MRTYVLPLDCLLLEEDASSIPGRVVYFVFFPNASLLVIFWCSLGPGFIGFDYTTTGKYTYMTISNAFLFFSETCCLFRFEFFIS